MTVNAAVVIPVYKETLNEFEKISLEQVQKVLGKYQIIFVAPKGLQCDYFIQGCKIYYFNKQFFQSVNTYNELMKHPLFYKAFLEYEYILIYQLDAFVFSDMLEYFCSLGYDYIGAAWYPLVKVNLNNKIYKLSVGNGGFSLRNVKTFYNFLLKQRNWSSEVKNMNEDVFFALCGNLYPAEFKVAPLKIACKFSFEHGLNHFVKKNGGELPFGCHAWYLMNGEFALRTFPKFGYNLYPLREKLYNRTVSIKWRLTDYAGKRLIRRLQRGQSILRYLSKNHYASIRVIRNPVAMIIFARLILENNNLSDETFFYNEDETDILIQDLKLERHPHLLITTGGGMEETLLLELAKRGINYGTRVVSFGQEYLNYCTEKFKNLGK